MSEEKEEIINLPEGVKKYYENLFEEKDFPLKYFKEKDDSGLTFQMKLSKKVFKKMNKLVKKNKKFNKKFANVVLNSLKKSYKK